MATPEKESQCNEGAQSIMIDPEDASHLAHILHSRHSVRAYLPKPVPRKILDEALALAQTSPSNSNTQPWRVYVTTGKKRLELGEALVAAASGSSAPPAIPPLPEAYRHYRRELGMELYGRAHGIPRDDTTARREAVMENFKFFGAPVGIVLCMDNNLEMWDAMSVGLYLQTFTLALTARGIGTCIEVSVAGYPEVCRQQLGIPENEKVLCGIAVGWPDETTERRSINHLRYTRDSVESCVKFYQ